jgi:HSP20 family protein
MQIRDLIPWNQERQTENRLRADQDNPVSALQRDLNRVFEEFWSRFDAPVGGQGVGMSGFGPSTDLEETESAVDVKVDLPGMSENDVDVSLTDDMLTIRGEKQDERAGNDRSAHVAERRYGAFCRAIPLPPDVDTDNATATLKNGQLTVSLPKTEQAAARAKRIDVKAA